jgi:catechol 2,3-dioxygenase-like lactoylglutathione lyase family enzyme
VVLSCTDLAASAEFYTGLGLALATERHGSGPEHLAAVLDSGCVLELYPAGAKGATHPLRLGLSVQAAASSLGPGNHVVTDPDGRTVVVDVEDGTRGE